MNHLKLFSKVHFLFTIVIFVVSCARTPVTQDFPETANPKTELDRFESNLQDAYKNHVNVLAPYNYKEAQEHYNKASQSLKSGKDSEKTLKHVAKGRAYLSRALEFSELANANLKEVVVARELAMKAQAPVYQAKDFAETDEDLMDVTRDIEKNDLEKADEEKSELQLAYLDIELKSLKLASTSSAQATIDIAVKEDAENYAPRSLAIAIKSIADVNAYITNNRRDYVNIKSMSRDSNDKAIHLLKITREAKAGKNISDEDSALQMESALIKVEMKDGQIADQNQQLQDNRTEVGALSVQNKDLEDKSELNEKYDAAMKSFKSDEADVYKQGSTLVIRLKGLTFPTAAATIKGDSFQLLSKVQQVINDFDGSSIVVEGHTDSLGKKATNQKLSTERAEAVKNYLETHSDGKALDISAVGMDSQKPLASNSTNAGRAKNRRVDVLINQVSE